MRIKLCCKNKQLTCQTHRAVRFQCYRVIYEKKKISSDPLMSGLHNIILYKEEIKVRVSVSVVVGVPEGVHVLPQGYWFSVLYASVLLLLCLVICLVGAHIYAKASFLTLLVVTVAVLSILISPLAIGPRSFSFTYKLGPNNTVTRNASYTGFNGSTLANNLWCESPHRHDRTSLVQQGFSVQEGVWVTLPHQLPRVYHIYDISFALSCLSRFQRATL